MFNPVDPGGLSQWDKIAFSEAIEDMIELDVAVVAASGNIHVSPYLKVNPTSDGG